MSNIGNRIIIDQLPSLNETPEGFNNKPQHAVHVKLFTVFVENINKDEYIYFNFDFYQSFKQH